MRWFWIDRFRKFVRGRSATAVKNVTLAEEHLHDHFPGVALMPNTLVIEGMAQTAGLLVADSLGFKIQVVLAKIAKADFRFDAVPGDTIEYAAEIMETMDGGSLVSVAAPRRGRTLLRPSGDGRGRAAAVQDRRDAPLARRSADLRRGRERGWKSRGARNRHMRS